MNKINGAIPSKPDIRDYRIACSSENVEKLPASYVCNYPPIKDQGSRNTCVPHALSECIEYHNQRQLKSFSEFSTDFIYGYRYDMKYKGEGMYIRDALKVIQKHGDVHKVLLPTNSTVEQAIIAVDKDKEKYEEFAQPNRISTYFKINNPTELKYAIYQYGPVIAGMRIFNNLKLDRDNVYIYQVSSIYSGHAILIVGWDEKNWIVQNSWGRFWGDKGLFKIPILSSFEEVLFDVYGITDDIVDSSDIIPPSPTVSIFSSIINLILKLLKSIFR